MLCCVRGAVLAASLLLTWSLTACDRGSAPDSVQASEPGSAPAIQGEGATQGPQRATPPFAVQGELEGLLLVWFDGEGTHTAKSLADIPEPHREQVRVDSPSVPPEKRLPAEQVYVADLREPDAHGTYPVHIYARSAFDELVDTAIAAVAPKAEDVVLYKASWCGVCKQAAAFFEQQRIPFVERDVEKDPGANAEMQRKARAAGKTPRGVPVIDFHGHIVLGFDRQALTSLIARAKDKAI